MADNDEFKMMGFRELEKYRKKEGRYHEQDPRHPDNSFDTDDDVKRAYRIKMGLQERKEIDAKKDTKGELEALPVVRDEEVKKVFEQIKKEEIKKGNRPKELKAAKGASISKQMELFEDGGLKQEGGMVDEVSGNDVPPGSTREEVRDDIPAQLSEGEFVFPADVVRYIGLEKLMRLRQEAKQGLKAMEAMGQMGNSDEAIMPDDLPFDETDLDIEDEEEYNNDTQEMNQGGMVRVGGIEMPRPIIAGQQMAEGGVVKAQTGTFVNPGTGVTSVPSQFAGQNLPSYRPNQTLPATTRRSYTVPTIPGQITGYRPTFYGQPPAGSKGVTTPTFETLVGRNPGQYDELREYMNDAGMKLQIPFRNGQPIYPIPEGYKYIDPEKEETETAKIQTTQTGTTQVSGDGGDNIGSRVGTTMVGKTGKGVTDKSLSTAEKTANVVSALEQNTPKSTLGKAIEAGAKGLMGAMMPGVGLLGGTALGAKSFFSSSGTSTQGLQGLGFTFDTAQGIGYDVNGKVTVSGPMASVMGRPAVMDMLSQQAYGMSLADKAKELGLSLDEYSAVAFSKGYKNGQVDPVTGLTYSHGQAGEAYGVPAYSSIEDFGKAMAASAQTGFYGSLATAKAIATDPTKTAKQKAKAIAFGKKIDPKFEMDIDTRTDAEVEAELDAIEASVQSQADKERGFDVNETFGTGESTSTGTGTGTSGVSTVGDDPTGPGDPGVSPGDPTADGSESTGSKIICTAMNKMYGLPMYSNRVWMRYNKYKKLDNAWELGYHKIFLSLVKKMPTNKYIRKSLEWFANTRTHGLKEEMKGNMFTVNALILRPLFSPIVYITGKLVQKGILKRADVKSI